VLCLLSKSDKLSRSGRERALRLAATGKAAGTWISFSAITGEGVNAARLVLEKWLSDSASEKPEGDPAGAATDS
jgi:hypothetical protein